VIAHVDTTINSRRLPGVSNALRSHFI
jgi:hypothetical protein